VTPPKLSIVIVSYNMRREIPRTVLSFLPPYQRGVQDNEIEVIVVENGSEKPIEPETIATWPKNVRYVTAAPATPSPAPALNQGAALARGEWVCLVIDGARVASPGLAAKTLAATRIADEPVICTVGLHLGENVQQFAVAEGYNQDAEDELLRSIEWPKDGYRLFEISCFAGSSRYGWFEGLNESNAMTMRKACYERIGGFNERFDIPGGGFVNYEFFKRSVEDPATSYVLLLGEGTFHQYHGGVTTSRPIIERSIEDESRTTMQVYADQYREICGAPWTKPTTTPILFGEMEQYGRMSLMRAAKKYAAANR